MTSLWKRGPMKLLSWLSRGIVVVCAVNAVYAEAQVVWRPTDPVFMFGDFSPGRSLEWVPYLFNTPRDFRQHICDAGGGGKAANIWEMPPTHGWWYSGICEAPDHTPISHGTNPMVGLCPCNGGIPDLGFCDLSQNVAINLHNDAFSFDDGTSGGSGGPANIDVGFTQCRVVIDVFKTPGPTCTRTGNPIDPFTGNKYQSDIDHAQVGDSPLVFERHYNSHVGHPYQDVWTHTYYRRVAPGPFPLTSVSVFRPEGKRWTFEMFGNLGTPDLDIAASLTRLTDGTGQLTGWIAKTPEDETEQYDVNGRLSSIVAKTGRTTIFSYSNENTDPSIAPAAGLLISATDEWGRALQFAYDVKSRLRLITEPNLATITYEYDSNGQLFNVTYPDNSKRTYLYNESAYTSNTNLPYALTGIVDENRIRYATFRYDSAGRAISSEHSNSADKVSLSYSASFNGPHQITDGKGTLIRFFRKSSG